MAHFFKNVLISVVFKEQFIIEMFPVIFGSDVQLFIKMSLNLLVQSSVSNRKIFSSRDFLDVKKKDVNHSNDLFV